METISSSPRKGLTTMASIIKHPRSGIYYAIIRENKKQIWRSLRTRNALDAHKAINNLISLRNPRNKTLLSHQILDYTAFIKATRGIKTVKIYEHALGRFMQFTEDIQIYDITRKHLDAFIVESTKSMKNISINVQIRAIKAFFNCIKAWQVIQTNPMDGVKQLRIQEKIPAFFTLEELHLFLDSIKEDEWLHNIVLFAAFTGARLGEIINLRWKDIDLINKSIHIQSSINYQVKAGKMRTIPMNDELFALLSNMTSKQEYVFKGRRNSGRAFLDYVSRQFKKAVRANGLSNSLHFHSLRHTFASILAQKGVSLFFIQKLLGHSNISMTQIYSHLETSNLFSSVNLLKLR